MRGQIVAGGCIRLQNQPKTKLPAIWGHTAKSAAAGAGLQCQCGASGVWVGRRAAETKPSAIASVVAGRLLANVQPSAGVKEALYDAFDDALLLGQLFLRSDSVADILK